MSAWSDFCRKYATENGITYSEASKLAIVKELYNLQKSEAIIAANAVFLEKIDEAIIAFEAKKALVEQPEDSTVTVTYDQAENDWREAVRNESRAALLSQIL